MSAEQLFPIYGPEVAEIARARVSQLRRYRSEEAFHRAVTDEMCRYYDAWNEGRTRVEVADPEEFAREIVRARRRLREHREKIARLWRRPILLVSRFCGSGLGWRDVPKPR